MRFIILLLALLTSTTSALATVSLTVNGTTYDFPQSGDDNWGTEVTDWATQVSNSTLQKTGGTFTLTAETDFGPSFGLKSTIFKSRTANPGSTGALRLANADTVVWRNATNTGDLPLGLAVNVLRFNGIDLVDVSSSQTLSSKTLTSPVVNGSLTGTAILDEDNMASNSDTKVPTQQSVKAYADAITTSLGSHTSATSAHGVTGDIVGTGGIQVIQAKTIDADLNNVSNIENADIKAAAAIDRTKIANGTADHVVINSGAGALSSEAQLANTRGGTGQNSSAWSGIVKTTAGVWSTGTTTLDDIDNVNEPTPASGDVLQYNGADWVGSQVVNANVATAADIARSKLANGTPNHVLTNTGAGIMSSESQLLPVRGGTGIDSSASTGIPRATAGTWSFGNTNINDLNDVNATPEEGQALVWDSVGGQWRGGSSGDSSFRLQSYTTGGSDTITIKAGCILVNGLEYCTYSSGLTDAAITTDRTMTVSSVTSATHWVYIDTLATSDVTLSSGSGRIIKAVENADFYDSTENPYSGTLDMSRYVPIGHYTANGSDITGVFNQAFRYQDSWKNIKLIDDKVHIRYYRTTTQNIVNNSNTILDFATMDYDTCIPACVTTGASWKFTAPRSGKYLVSFTVSLLTGTTWAVGESAALNIWKNAESVPYAQGANFYGLDATSATKGASFSGEIYLAKGDYFTPKMFQNSGGDLAIQNESNGRLSWITISELSDSTTSAVLTPTNTYSERVTAKNTTCTDSTHKVTFPSWFTRTDYQCALTYHDASAARDFEVSGAVYDKDTAGYVCLDLSGLSFTTNDYLDVVCGLGPRATAFPLNQSQEKQYVFTSGGATSNCTSSTITQTVCSDIASFSLGSAVALPYRTQEGAWRMRFNIAYTAASAARTTGTLEFSGVLFKTRSPTQAISCFMNDSATVPRAVVESNTGNVTADHASITNTGYSCSGDVELNSKPTWAEGF